jgi:phage baseplate assembly protein W
MIPSGYSDDDIMKDLDETSEPSYTYKLDTERDRIIDYCDNLEAVKQAIYKILGTERYDYVIYSQNYGIELEELIGEPTSYVIPELERRITEALMQDDRILAVYDFEFDTPKKNVVTVTFSVDTDFGTTEIEREVEY